MKNALDWIKSNPISAASVIVAFISVLVFAYVLFVQAPALRARVIAENDSQAKELHALTHATFELPNPDPNAPPIPISGQVINGEIIEYVSGVYTQIREQSDTIRSRTRERNAAAHESYTFARGEVFGSERPSTGQIVRATEDYLDSFDAMFNEGYDDLRMPLMYAGMPPTPEELQERVDQMLYDYLSSVGAATTSELTKEQAETLYQLQQVAAMTLLKERAEQVNIYADVMPLPPEFDDEGNPIVDPDAVGMARYSVDYPFEIAPWATAAEQAKLDQLWEGQVQVWIMRDIMQAIANTNAVQREQPDGTIAWEILPVFDAPVKRLLSLDVVPGYVGLHSGGAISPTAGSSGGAGGTAPGGMMPGAMMGGRDLGGRSGARGGALGGRGGASPGPGALEPGLSPAAPQGSGDGVDHGTGAATTPAAPAAVTEVSTVYRAPAVTTLPPSNQPIIDSFFFGPSGRFSNNVFDVRHVELTLHIEWEALPDFFEQLRQVNFMTVIDMEVTDIDEYGDVLADGYIYQGDVVKVDLVIETLWFREWTTELMPQIVKNALAVPAPTP